MNKHKIKFSIFIISTMIIFSCSNDDQVELDMSNDDCMVGYELDSSRGLCDQLLPETPTYDETINPVSRIIITNSIPNHDVGLFGQGPGSLNPNLITVQNESYTITNTPSIASSYTALLAENGIDFSFGVLLNGIELDPIAAEPFPHRGVMDPDVNWEWNLEAINVNLGLDCNNAHVQPSGKYHYHGFPTLFLDNLNVQNNQMTLVGYAADGFPIYYKYAYQNSLDNSSSIVVMTSSYQLKSGNRPGNGVTAPCGAYDGVYSADYEYVEGLGTLDQANGRTGVTPEYPNGTYYYMLTDDFPIIPRYFRGTPSESFRI